MKKTLIILTIGLTAYSCSVVSKSKQKQKEKVETYQSEVRDLDLKSDISYSTFDQKSKIADFTNLLSALNWNYSGQDSAEIEISQTATGIKIKTKGTATADLKVNSESETNKIQETTETAGESQSEIHLKVNSETKTETKSKTIQQEKEVKRFDLSAWWWIILLILAVTALGLYWFFGKPKSTGVPLPRNPLPPPPEK